MISAPPTCVSPLQKCPVCQITIPALTDVICLLTAVLVETRTWFTWISYSEVKNSKPKGDRFGWGYIFISTLFTRMINGRTLLAMYGWDIVEVNLIGYYKRMSISYCVKRNRPVPLLSLRVLQVMIYFKEWQITWDAKMTSEVGETDV